MGPAVRSGEPGGSEGRVGQEGPGAGLHRRRAGTSFPCSHPFLDGHGDCGFCFRNVPSAILHLDVSPTLSRGDFGHILDLSPRFLTGGAQMYPLGLGGVDVTCRAQILAHSRCLVTANS